MHANRHLRVIGVGAGASGLCLAYKLKHYFTDFTLNIYEKNEDIGGTWFENRYPGCACDVPAHNYTYSFHPNLDWSANYASSTEIYKYFKNFADTYGLREYLSCNHEVTGAVWDEAAKEWDVTIKRPDGTEFKQYCDFFINAAGILNNWRWPAVSGLQSFKGPLLHSAAWDESVDLTGKRVGLIGNGSSGIQLLPQIEKIASHVTTFFRSPTWVSPTKGMEFHEYTDEERAEFRNVPGKNLEMRKATERAIAVDTFPLLLTGSASNLAAAEYMRQQMKLRLGNEELASRLLPKFPVGCRRFTPGVGYLESLGKKNVTVIFDEVVKLTPASCVTRNGTEIELDAMICATGFDTSFRPRFPIIGRGGKDLREEWADEPRSYLSIAAHGFPNYFMFLGPNSPVGNGPFIVAMETEVDYMAQFMDRWQKEDVTSFDPKLEAVNDFIEQKDAAMSRTVWAGDCPCWYKDRRSSKIIALWPGSTLHYMEALAQPRYEDYEITYRSGNRFAYFGNGFSQTELCPDIDPVAYIRDGDDGVPISRRLQLGGTWNAKTIGDVLTIAKKLTM
ncbi:FAD/NAD(P)-binding domain-containing protein [Plenodomus tracheiphilus IPT5]|uniref:FAD/NAD(P)-binding domain-containing protein n=1 Tax=Plenodomus tracheiphilus IPT5 TaxID=1408161 RepID=A0A6A7AR80_9PLEO|nr:FAD/NAD(P)-binding domain-containing protein [Plenodomus tracheiphilus IPT5]